MALDRIYGLGFDVRKAISEIDRLQKRYNKLQSDIEKNKSFKSGKGLSSQINLASTAFNRFGISGESAVNKILEALIHAGHGVRAFKEQINSREIRDSAAIKGLKKSLKDIGTETTNVSKKVAKFLGADIQTPSDRAEKNLKDVAKQGTKLGKDISGGAKEGAKELKKTGDEGKKSGKKISDGAKKGTKGLKEIDVGAKVASLSLTKLALKITAVVGAFQAVRQTTTDFLEFDDVITTAAAKFSSVDKDIKPGSEAFNQLRKNVRAATKETEFSATVGAQAIDFWAKAGKNAEQAQVVLPISLDFASATKLSADEAGDILSDALGQFQLNTPDPTQFLENTTRIADVMSKAANTANFSAAEMFESFKQAGPVLTAADQSIEETAGFLAALANAGIKGSNAGVALKTITTSIVAPTEKQSKIYKKLNIQTKDAQGNFLGLTKVFGQVAKATEKMGSGDRLEIFAELTGARGLPGFINLLNVGEKELNNMSDALDKSSGETRRLAEFQRQSAKSGFQQFLNKLEDIGLAVLEDTNIFGRLNKTLKNVNIKDISNWVNNKLIPGLEWLGNTITKSIIPAFKDIYDIVKSYLVPVFDTVISTFKSFAGEGDGLRSTLKLLLETFLAFKFVSFIGGLTSIIGRFQLLNPLLSTATTNSGNLQGAFGKLGGAASKLGNALNILGGIIQAAAVGWAIGTVIHDNLVEPIAKARDDIDKIRQDINDSMSKFGKKGRAQGSYENDLKLYEAELERLKSKTELEQNTPFIKQRIAQLDDYIKKTEAKIAELNQARNIKNYTVSDTDTGQSIQSPDMRITEYEDDWAMQSITDFSQVSESLKEVVTDINKVKDSFNNVGQTVIPELNFDATESMSGEVSGALSPAIVELNDSFKTQTKQSDLYNQKNLEYQKQMLDATKKQKPPVVNNITVGSTNVSVNASGANANEVARLVDRRIQENNRIQRAGIEGAVRSATSGEY